MEVRAVVELGPLTPDDVQVQVAFGAVDEYDELRDPVYLPLDRSEPVDGSLRYEGKVPLARRGAFGYTVRVLPNHPLLASSAELGLVVLPLDSTAYTTV
jgi:starch phosphorylase